MTSSVVPATEVAIKEPPEIEHHDEKHPLTFQEYLSYEGEPGVLYELVRGKLIPMGATTHNHTNIGKFLVHKFQRYLATKKLDLVVTGLATGVRTEENSSRIPDVVVYSKAVWNKVRHHPGAGVLDFEEKPMLVIEIVSSNRREDYVIKRNEYEVAEIAEYWIVDAKKKRVRVFANPSNEEGYRFVDFTEETSIVSGQFEGLDLSVKELLDPPSVEDLILAEQAEMETWKQQAETERQRAEKLAQRLLKMGVPPDEIDKIFGEN